MNNERYDLAIVGSGGGAFAAAIRATGLGKRVVMVERGTVGGTCVNTGCVPSKALLAAAEARHVALDAARFPGVAAAAGPVDMPALIQGKAALVEGMRTEKYLGLAADYGWAMVAGDASFTGTQDAPLLRVVSPDGAVTTIEAGHYLMATGAAPYVPPVPGLAESGYLTSTTAMELDEVPESLLIMGGGYVALEMAQLFSRLGSRVTMLVRSRLASQEEPEVAKALAEVFADEGIRVVRRATVDNVERDEASGGVIASASVAGGKETFRADRLLVAVENAFTDALAEVDYRHLPRVTFTSPAVGAVGMTEKEAVAAGIRCECRVLPLEYVPRALVNRDTRGFIKVVAELGTGRILGISAVARDAGEIAAAGVYILEAGMTTAQVAAAWCPYLTMAEGIRIAAKAFTTDVSKLSCCA